MKSPPFLQYSRWHIVLFSRFNSTGSRYGFVTPEKQGFENKEMTEHKTKLEADVGTLTYGETQVNLIKANIFKKRTVNTPFKRWVKCTHCLSMFSSKASLTRHLKRFNCKEESRELNSLSYLSLSEIKEAIYGSKVKKKQEGKNAVPVIHEFSQPSGSITVCLSPSAEVKSTQKSPPYEPQTLLNCEYCSKAFTQKRTLNAHLTTHRKQEYLCPVCGKRFSYKSSLVSHQTIHQKLPKSHSCSQCNAAFTTLRSLRRHYFTHYNYRDKEFICELCGKRFAYSMTLKNHKLSHSEERPHACRICGTTFKRTTHLRTHEQGVHGLHDKVLPKKYTCDICQKSMVRKESLEAHMKEHTGELNYQCKDCYKKFATNTGLNIHISMGRCNPWSEPCDICSSEMNADTRVCEHVKNKMEKRRQKVKSVGAAGEVEKSSKKKFPVPRHLKERNYICKACGKYYIYPCELKTHHRLAHTDEKPFVCGRCGKAFKTKASLQMHEDVHNDLRPFTCKVCEKKFRKTEHLKLHMRTHTGEKPHICDVCGRGFAQKGDMKKHILKTHNRPKVEGPTGAA
ncbi:hypothetical protein RUM44_000613 [Polyplax serrata]|uniref:C2H2-type domain-containing protein n=1 Tax=Polyplax serrata TaxID=468196 RepID=A0ABR1B5X4_POLSC